MRLNLLLIGLIGAFAAISCAKQFDDLNRVAENKPKASLLYNVKYTDNPNDTVEEHFNAKGRLNCNYYDSIQQWGIEAATTLPFNLLKINTSTIKVGTSTVGSQLSSTYSEVFRAKTFDAIKDGGNFTISNISSDSLCSGTFYFKLIQTGSNDPIRIISGSFSNIDVRIVKN